MVKGKFVILFVFLLCFGAFFASAEKQNLCLSTGETIKLCNIYSDKNFSCDKSSCKICVEYRPLTGTFCQYPLSECSNPQCTYLTSYNNTNNSLPGNNTGGIGSNNTQNNISYVNFTKGDITVKPTNVIYYNKTTGHQINVSFESNVYPLNYNLSLVKTFGDFISFNGLNNKNILSNSSFPIKYSISRNLNYPNGTYNIRLILFNSTKVEQYIIGQFIVGQASPVINNTNSTNPPANQTNNSSEWVLSNIITSPSFNFNVMNGTEKELKIDFESNRYPLNITLKIDGINLDNVTISYQNITNSTNGTEQIQLTNITLVNKTYIKNFVLSNYSSLYYNITSDFLNGTYYANISFIYGNQTKTSYLGQFNVGNYVEQVNNGDSNQNTGSGGSGGGGGGGGRSSRAIVNNTNTSIVNSTVLSNNITEGNQSEIDEESLESKENERGIIASITGAVIGSDGQVNYRNILIISLVFVSLVVVVNIIRKKKTSLGLIKSGKKS